MDGFAKAEQLTAHIGDPTRRARVRSNLTRFFADLEAIPDDDEAEMEPEPQSYRDDGSDGVPITTVCEIGKQERERLDGLRGQVENLRTLHRDMPPQTETDEDVTVEADVNEQGKRGLTPLHQAVMDEDLELCIELRQRGARTDIPDNSGFTALDRAKFRADDSDTAKKIAELLDSPNR